MRAALFLSVVCSCALAAEPAAAAGIPACRLDDTFKEIVESTVDRAIRAYHALGKALPIDAPQVNPRAFPIAARTLKIFIVRDAAQADVKPDGCAVRLPEKSELLDKLSVRGGCVIVATSVMEMRCSSAAVRIFGASRARDNRADPALLYLVAHELAHVIQGYASPYSGREEPIVLKDTQAAKLQLLRDVCDPVSTKREEEADALSLQVMGQLLSEPPYRETVFTERGSMYWNIDLLALATDAWRREALERDILSAPKLHSAFEPTEFPTPAKKINAAARRFVCDVLTKNKGVVLHPGRPGTHPPLEQRLRSIAEALKPIAYKLPATGGDKNFQPIARLQTDLSPVFTHIYRETGAYLEAVQAKICTAVNAPKPAAACR
jgi:hypothetical protein